MQAYKCVPHQGFCDNVEKFGQICDLFLWLFSKKNYQKRKSKFLIKQKESNWGSK